MNCELPMTVLHVDEESGTMTLAVINVLEVDFIENDGRRFVYHIGDDIYYQIVNKSEMEQILETRGFEVLDRPYLVNMKRISWYDEKFHKAFFKSRKYVTVARGRVDVVKKYIDQSEEVDPT